MRGGSAGLGDDFCKVSFRHQTNPYNRFDDCGFRLARTVK